MSGPPSSIAPQISGDVLRDKTQEFPPEIMSKIFTLVSDGEIFIPVPHHRDPWFIGHVCSRWRRILWDIPSIWNTIRIGYHEADTPNPSADGDIDESVEGLVICSVLSYIFSRHSGTISLTVGSYGRRYLNSLFPVILTHFHRLTEASIDGLDQSALFTIFDLPTSTFAQLEKLCLSSIFIDKPFPTSTTSPLQAIPTLRGVTYQISSPYYIPSLLLLPWAAIEHISVRGMQIPPEMVFHIFQSSPRLKTCHLIIDTTCDIPHAPEAILPALSLLSLRTESTFDWDKFLSVVTAPTLKSLSLVSPRIPCEPLASLVTRSLCPMVDLNIHSANLEGRDDDESVELLLTNLTSLSDLVVPWSIPPSIFRRIQSGVFPKLERAVVFVGPDGLGAFLDMVEMYIDPPRRWPGNLTITIKCRPGPGLVEQENRYMANGEAYDSVEGLTVTVFDFNYSTVRPLGM